jgi:hypothetical protein
MRILSRAQNRSDKKVTLFSSRTFWALHARRPGLLGLSSKAKNLSELLNDFLNERPNNRKSSKTPQNKTTATNPTHIHPSLQRYSNTEQVYSKKVTMLEHATIKRTSKEVKQSRYRPGVAQRVPGS